MSKFRQLVESSFNTDADEDSPSPLHEYLIKLLQDNGFKFTSGDRGIIGYKLITVKSEDFEDVIKIFAAAKKYPVDKWSVEVVAEEGRRITKSADVNIKNSKLTVKRTR